MNKKKIRIKISLFPRMYPKHIKHLLHRYLLRPHRLQQIYLLVPLELQIRTHMGNKTQQNRRHSIRMVPNPKPKINPKLQRYRKSLQV